MKITSERKRDFWRRLGINVENHVMLERERERERETESEQRREGFLFFLFIGFGELMRLRDDLVDRLCYI
ncbi:MAG: hypothetical protein J8272_00495 ['Prunus persica' phytoplasma PP2]|nr:hypothetical protein ['Prunus persica' phytoplasma PP2]